MPREEWFGFYTRQFNTVEINNTFYNLPEAEASAPANAQELKEQLAQ